jgi:acetolactate synthase I/II/III large subunit
VPTHLIGNDAFQECDTVGITRPCTKYNYLVKNIADLPRALHEAFHIAASGRPGPVVVDIPKDIQFAKGTYAKPKEFQHRGYQPKLKGDLDKIKQAVEMMAAAKRPLFYTGGGVVNSGRAASDLLTRRISCRRPAVARHARHARHLGGQLVDARLRPDDRGRLSL